MAKLQQPGQELVIDIEWADRIALPDEAVRISRRIGNSESTDMSLNNSLRVWPDVSGPTGLKNVATHHHLSCKFFLFINCY